MNKLQPVRLGLGRGVLGDLAFNRRGICRDSTIAMPKPLGREQQPFGIADICYLEGADGPQKSACAASKTWICSRWPFSCTTPVTRSMRSATPRPTGPCPRIGRAHGRGKYSSDSAPTPCHWSSTAVAATSTPGIPSTQIADRITSGWAAN